MKVKVYFTDKQDIYPVGRFLKKLVARAVYGTLKYVKFPYEAEVSVTFCDDAYIRELNREHRNNDASTDVLSFPMYNFRNRETPTDGKHAEIGDIVISLEHAYSQAHDYGHSTTREVSFLAVHSVLHLLGYDHEVSDEEEEVMFGLQDKIMDYIGITR